MAAVDIDWEFAGAHADHTPFDSVELDFDSQTGADWYMMAISATYDGRAVHGLNFAPTCETLAKVDYAFAEKHIHGVIGINTTVREVDSMGSEWWEKPYAGHDFKGVRSTPATILAMDEEHWEPSSRTRAKNAAFLAAGLAAHSGDIEEACDTVGAIVGSEVPEELVRATLVPVSHVRRDIVSTDKANHTVFSAGTTQRALVWKDANLAREKLVASAAVDWGRVTTIARYIGEANSKYDPLFRAIAGLRGVPYALISGAWATVSEADYLLGDVVAIPRVKLKEKGISEVAVDYEEQVEEITTNIVRLVNSLAYSDAAVTQEALLDVVARVRAHKKTSARVALPASDVLADVTQYAMDTQSASAAVIDQATTFKALAKAVRYMAASDASLAADLRILVVKEKERRLTEREVDEMTERVFTKATWLMAASLLAARLGNAETAKKRMTRLKQSTMRSSAGLNHEALWGKFAKLAARPRTIALARAVALKPAPKKPPNLAISMIRGSSTAIDVQKTLANMFAHFSEFARAWADRYESWARAYAAVEGTRAHKMSVLHGGAAAAFRALTPSGVLTPDSGFVDMTNPFNVYLWQIATNYARKRHLKKPMIQGKPPRTAQALAHLLDSQYNPEVTFVEMEDFVRGKLAMFANDFADGRAPEAPNDFVVLEPEGAVKEEEDEDDFDFDDDDGGELDFSRSPVDVVLNSYPDSATAESHAIANGYDSFEDAYEALGNGARFDPASPYTQKGVANSRSQETKEDQSQYASLA